MLQLICRVCCAGVRVPVLKNDRLGESFPTVRRAYAHRMPIAWPCTCLYTCPYTCLYRRNENTNK